MTTAARFALVTGAGSGIGREIARALARENWFVGLVDVDAEAVAALATEIGEGATAIVADVSNAESVGKAFAAYAEKSGGKLDLLVNNAGLLFTGNFEDQPLDRLAQLLAVNNLGPALCCRTALPMLIASARRGGRSAVVNLASASAIFGIPSMAAYSASKFWVRGFTEALAGEWARYGISVRDVIPPFVNTPMLKGGQDHLLMKRLGVNLEPEAVAKQVLIAARRGPLHRFVTLDLKALKLISHILPAAVMRFGLAWISGYWPVGKAPQ